MEITLEEAIQHCEEVAMDKTNLAQTLWDSKEKARCKECADEHRQIAEWLKDYKRLLDQEPCEDFISREAVLDLCDSKDPDYKIYHLKEDVECLPPVYLKPKTGHWISFETQGEIDGQIVQAFTCSECGAISIFRVSNENIVNGDSCPNCGARMNEEVQE